MLRLEKVSYAYPGAERPALHEVSLRMRRGQCHCLVGATGSGKTTLALVASGLVPAEQIQGRVEVAGASQAHVGLVLDDVETQIFSDTVAAEVAFGLENRCVAPQAMPAKIKAALSAVGLDKPLEFPTARLSMGQKYRLLIAAQLVLDPSVLILDEPVAQLDPQGLDSLISIIGELKRRGVAVLLCENISEPLAAVIDQYWQFADAGTVVPGRPAPRKNPVADQGRSRLHARSNSCIVLARALSLSPADATPAWSNASLAVHAGQRVAFCARNGAGKTSLLRCLTGFIPPASGEVQVLGAPPSPQGLRGRIGYLAQNPERQLFETTVFDEVSFSLRRLGVRTGQLCSKVEAALACCGIGELAARSPHRLSYGQKRLVALASIVAVEPALLLLDDPFGGLDSDRSEIVGRLLIELSERHGTAVLWTSHDGLETRKLAHTTLTIEEGTLVAA